MSNSEAPHIEGENIKEASRDPHAPERLRSFIGRKVITAASLALGLSVGIGAGGIVTAEVGSRIFVDHVKPVLADENAQLGTVGGKFSDNLKHTVINALPEPLADMLKGDHNKPANAKKNPSHTQPKPETQQAVQPTPTTAVHPAQQPSAQPEVQPTTHPTTPNS